MKKCSNLDFSFFTLTSKNHNSTSFIEKKSVGTTLNAYGVILLNKFSCELHSYTKILKNSTKNLKNRSKKRIIAVFGLKHIEVSILDTMYVWMNKSSVD